MTVRPPSVVPSVDPPSGTHVLSNGRLSVMLTGAGAGFSQWQDLAITRWREDPVVQSWGSFLLLRDEDSGAVWSPCAQPFGDASKQDRVSFAPGRARFESTRHAIHSVLEVAVAADRDIELRRLTLSNRGDAAIKLSVTSYAELVLGPSGADRAHPAFSKMFVQTAWEQARGVLLGTRRHRATDDPDIWAAHALQLQGAPDDDADPAALEYETDRANFLGRTRELRGAQAMQPDAALSGTVGCVLDPVFAMRRSFSLAAGASVSVLAWTALAASREEVLAMAASILDQDALDGCFDAAGVAATQALAAAGIDAASAHRHAHWLAALLGQDGSQRAAAELLARGHGGPPTLWAGGISGDRPILLLLANSADAVATTQDVLRAQRYWQSQRVAVDVVLMLADTAPAADIDALATKQQQALKEAENLPKAELFVLKEASTDAVLRDGLITAARVVLDTGAKPAAADRGNDQGINQPAIVASEVALPVGSDAGESLEFDNGHGGFVDAGRAYRIALDDEHPTPAPWVNVIANPHFGFVVSAEGGGYAWSLNSQQNPLTPWPNDPVSDRPHEALYLRDEESGECWTTTALPIRVPGAEYLATHGKGWSRFDCDAHGIASTLTQCVPLTDPVKLSRLTLCNRSNRTRQLTLTAYVEWALGANGTTPAPYVITSRDATTGAVFARNRWRQDFGERVAFADLGGLQQSVSGDRRSFLGELGDVGDPAALREAGPLDGRLGAGLDPCAALQVRIELPPHTQMDLRWLLGDAANEAAAQALVQSCRDRDIDDVLAEVDAQWIDVLDTVQVRTPDRSIDILLNDCLLYQVLACRLWARTAYYQASGAYGYRDQLQDVMALCVSRPDLAREHLLRAAGRQFAEGDVQHWWLPPGGAGIRTRISDDRIWLAYVAMHYTEVSGDSAVLDEVLPFLAGQSIPTGSNDAFFQPSISETRVSVYEHCARAIDTSLTRGSHGLPLIETGDWNDGMNAVGEKGRGESSWLGWLLLATIDAFAPCAEQRGQSERATTWRDYATALRVALEQAWDGQWYRRGYYDDGTPLGSHENDECRIDTIAQSWSAIAGASDTAHVQQAMASNDRLLVDHSHGIARLFTPPFDHGQQNPGYIRGYPPGVRENGGQYTHGATWSVFAWAKLGDGERCGALFDLLNPIRHSDSAEAIALYKVEPYVVSADVYSEPPYVGRGGWTWYTGSAAWLYRAGMEALLGFHLQGDRLRIDPCIPKDWPGFQITYQHRGKQQVSRYEIAVENPDKVGRGVRRVELDGQTLDAADAVALVDDGQTHQLRVVLG
jgi:cyclic beta-1,2-glucan synthetase